MWSHWSQSYFEKTRSNNHCSLHASLLKTNTITHVGVVHRHVFTQKEEGKKKTTCFTTLTVCFEDGCMKLFTETLFRIQQIRQRLLHPVKVPLHGSENEVYHSIPLLSIIYDTLMSSGDTSCVLYQAVCFMQMLFTRWKPRKQYCKRFLCWRDVKSCGINPM